MAAYGSALVEMATALEGQDGAAAVAGADALGAAVVDLMEQVPGAPAPAVGFKAATEEVVAMVKQAVADKVPTTEIITTLQEAFANEGFEVGGDAIDDYVNAACPSASATPSAS